MVTLSIVTPDISAPFRACLTKLERGVKFSTIWGNAVAVKARQNARAKGGRRWWGDLARGVQVRTVDGDNTKADLTATQVGAAQKQYGGTIVPVNRQWLTIPIDKIAKGKRASELDTPEHPLFRPKGTNILAWNVTKGRGKNRYEEIRPLFALAKKAVQTRDPWFPESEEVYKIGLEEARRIFNEEVKK